MTLLSSHWSGQTKLSSFRQQSVHKSAGFFNHFLFLSGICENLDLHLRLSQIIGIWGWKEHYDSLCLDPWCHPLYSTDPILLWIGAQKIFTFKILPWRLVYFFSVFGLLTLPGSWFFSPSRSRPLGRIGHRVLITESKYLVAYW